MTEAELRSVFERLDAMSNRVDKVIGRERQEKPLRPDVSYPRRVVVAQAKPTPRHHVQRLQRDTGYSAIASGSLIGNEMRISEYRPQPCEDDDPTGMWAAFEADFDDMVKAIH